MKAQKKRTKKEKRSVACGDCLAGRCGRIYHCVDCGIQACSHTIRPQTPRNQPEVGRCTGCIRKLMATRPLGPVMIFSSEVEPQPDPSRATLGRGASYEAQARNNASNAPRYEP